MKAVDATKYERARIVGARALQIAMGAPILLKLKKTDYEELRYSPINIAKKEFEAGVLPLSIKRKMPKKTA
jgi:DNA-directed RNA polymerase subunit K